MDSKSFLLNVLNYLRKSHSSVTWNRKGNDLHRGRIIENKSAISCKVAKKDWLLPKGDQQKCVAIKNLTKIFRFGT